MEEWKTKKFTESAILFALTGHVFIRKDASLEYRKKCLSEIHDDSIYCFVFGGIPKNFLKSIWQCTVSESKDTDPVLVQYLSSKYPILAEMKFYSDEVPYPESSEAIEEVFLTNGYMDIEAIDFQDLCECIEKSEQVMNDNKKKLKK